MKNNKQHRYTNRAAVSTFSKWSRKGYAAFASLSMCVRIGCLSIDVCNVAVQKAKAVLCPSTKETIAINDDQDDVITQLLNYLLELCMSEENCVELCSETKASATNIDNLYTKGMSVS